MADPFSDRGIGTPSAFGRKGTVIAPGASNLPNVVKGIVCLAAGNVTLIPPDNADGETITFTGCPVGFVPPYQVRRVTAATGSWATIEG